MGGLGGGLNIAPPCREAFVLFSLSSALLALRMRRWRAAGAAGKCSPCPPAAQGTTGGRRLEAAAEHHGSEGEEAPLRRAEMTSHQRIL